MSNHLIIVQGVDKRFDVDLFDANGDPLSMSTLVDATATLLVRAQPSDVVDVLKLTTVDNPTRLSIDTSSPVVHVTILAADVADIPLGLYSYQLRVTPVDGTPVDAIAWSPFELTLGGSASPPLPPFDNVVKIDHDYMLPDDLAFYTPGGSPIVNAQIRVYRKSDYDAGRLDVPVGTTVTTTAGRWRDAILVEPGYSYVVRFEKPYEWSPVTREIFA